MKRIFFFFIVLFPLFLQAQTTWDKVGIQQMMEAYGITMEELDIKSSLDYILPKLFEIVPREAMEENFEEMLEDTTSNISFQDYEVNRVSKIIKKGGVYYARVNYQYILNMKIPSGIESETMDRGKFMTKMLEMRYGAGNVIYDDEIDSFAIKVKTSVFAIGDPEIGSWKMIENKDSAEELLLMIIPKKVYKKLG